MEKAEEIEAWLVEEALKPGLTAEERFRARYTRDLIHLVLHADRQGEERALALTCLGGAFEKGFAFFLAQMQPEIRLQRAHELMKRSVEDSFDIGDEGKGELIRAMIQELERVSRG